MEYMTAEERKAFGEAYLKWFEEHHEEIMRRIHDDDHDIYSWLMEVHPKGKRRCAE